jgi:hypothetical protein
MATARSFHTATLLLDGRVLIAGGNDFNPDAAASSTEIYDRVKQTFTPSGNMTAARSGHTATLLSDGRVLIVVGDSIGSVRGFVVESFVHQSHNAGAVLPKNHTPSFPDKSAVLAKERRCRKFAQSILDRWLFGS